MVTIKKEAKRQSGKSSGAGSFDDMAATVKANAGITPVDTDKRTAQRVLGNHLTIAATAGARVKVKVLECDPSRLRVWHGRDRDYELLSEETCKDLIDGFERAGQQMAVIARPNKQGDDFDYEIICGARRHWTSIHRNKRKPESLLVEIRNLDDEQAFVLQDIENRDRQDVTPYERAISYTKALDAYFGGVKRKMAAKLDMDESYFGALLSLADLPIEIVKAYPDRRDLVVDHMRTYKSLLKDKTVKDRVIKEAKALAKANPKQKRQLTGAEVLKRLRQAGQGDSAKQTEELAPEGKVVVVRSKQGQITIKVSPGENKASTLKHFAEEINKLRKELEESYD